MAACASARLLRRLVLCTLLGACGGAERRTQDDCGVPPLIRVSSVPALPAGRLGETDRCAPGATEIRVLRGLDRLRMMRLLAHELAHAAGYSVHLDDPACLLYPVILASLPPPCPLELSWLQAVPGPLTIQAEPELVEAVAGAATHWNNALGRTLFVVL